MFQMVEHNDSYWEQLSKIAARNNEPMETACRAVIALGYSFSDCRIDHYPEINGASRQVLVVAGVEAFEVTTSVTSDMDKYTITYHVQPKMLTWPQPKTAPQVTAPADTGGAKPT